MDGCYVYEAPGWVKGGQHVQGHRVGEPDGGGFRARWRRVVAPEEANGPALELVLDEPVGSSSSSCPSPHSNDDVQESGKVRWRFLAPRTCSDKGNLAPEPALTSETFPVHSRGPDSWQLFSRASSGASSDKRRMQFLDARRAAGVTLTFFASRRKFDEARAWRVFESMTRVFIFVGDANLLKKYSGVYAR